jgi:hypothetical protein
VPNPETPGASVTKRSRDCADHGQLGDRWFGVSIQRGCRPCRPTGVAAVTFTASVTAHDFQGDRHVDVSVGQRVTLDSEREIARRLDCQCVGAWRQAHEAVVSVSVGRLWFALPACGAGQSDRRPWAQPRLRSPEQTALHVTAELGPARGPRAGLQKPGGRRILLETCALLETSLVRIFM